MKRDDRGEVVVREDEVRALPSHVGAVIRVGEAEGTAARYSIPDQDAIDALLRALIAARAAQDGLGSRWEALVRVMDF